MPYEQHCICIKLPDYNAHWALPSHQSLLLLSQASACEISIKWHMDHLLCPHFVHIYIIIYGKNRHWVLTVSAQKGSFGMRRPATSRATAEEFCAELTLWHSMLSCTLTCPLQTGRWKCCGQWSFCSHPCVIHICRNLGMGTTHWWVLIKGRPWLSLTLKAWNI